MELPLLDASHLPLIKCSTCGQNIDLSSLADHTCPPSPNAPGPSVSASHQPPTATSTTLPPRDASFLRPQRPTLPKIDSSVAVPVPFAGELTPASSGHGSVGSPVSATSGRRSPWRAATRRPTIMIHQGPPSPELVNLDCAFPPFPGLNIKNFKKEDKSKSRSDKQGRSRPASPASSARSSKHYLGPSPLGRNTPNENPRPRSKSVSGDQRLRRPSISTNGRRPFASNTGNQKASAEDVPPMPAPSPDLVVKRPPIRPLERAETAPVLPLLGNSTGRTLDALQRHATTDGVMYSEPEETRVPPGQEIGDRTKPEFSNPFPLSQAHKDSEPAYKSKRPAPIISGLGTATREQDDKLKSSTVLPPDSANSLSRSLTKLFGRRRSQSVSVAKRGIVRVALSDEPDKEIPSPIPPSVFETPRQTLSAPQSAPDFTTQPSSAPGVVGDRIAERKDLLHAVTSVGDESPPIVVAAPEVPPASVSVTMEFNFGLESVEAGNSVPEPPVFPSIARRPTVSDPNRASIDSASSYGSIGFDERTERTASSRSSPPSTDELAIKLSSSLQSEPTQMTIVEMPLPLQPRNHDLSPDSPTDPLFIDGRLSPIPNEKPKPSGASPVISDMLPPSRPARPARQDSFVTGGNAAAPHKGICRGCSKPILPKQKSVTSADGRLTGRYHKECFVCSTCRSTFSTAEFYVHADRPYCAYHYHEQENSLCGTCGKGIEGLYTETANVAGRGREKHHPQCLKCTTCCVQLTNDYFELSGKVYCERDAFRLASVPKTHDRSPARPSPLVREYISSGDPKLLQKGTNFPERRITRIMTTTT